MNNEKSNPLEQLPFDVITLLIALKDRLKIFILMIVLSCITGITGAYFLGERTYLSESVLLFKPRSSIMGENRDIPSVLTQMNMVKLVANLSETRKLLKLDSSIESLAAGIDVSVRRDTDLMTISARWNDPQRAQQISNTITELFLSQQKKIRRAELKQFMNDVRNRLSDANEKLKNAEHELQTFTSENHVVDLDKQGQRYLDELANINTLLDEARIQKTTIDMQNENIDKIIDDLKTRISEESNSQTGADRAEDLELKSRRIRESIVDDRSHRAAMAELAAAEAEYERAKKLVDRQLIPRNDYTKIKANYERIKAFAVDTEKIKRLKAEMKKIDSTVIPEEKDASATVSGRLLQDIMLKAFDIQIKTVALDEKVKYMESSAQRVQDKLDLIPLQKQTLSQLERKLSKLEQEKMELDDLLRKAERTSGLELTDYLVVSPAILPVLPIKSNRRVLAFIITALLAIIGTSVLILLELLTPSVRSPSEVKIRTGIPVLASLPELGDDDEYEKKRPLYDEECRYLIQLINKKLPEKGAKIVVGGVSGGEGVTHFTNTLASLYKRQHKNVLVIEQLTRHNFDKTANYQVTTNRYLSNYDAINTDPDNLVIVLKDGISHITIDDGEIYPDLIRSEKWSRYLDKLALEFDVIIIEAPAARRSTDMHFLARNSDACILVAKSGSTSSRDLNNIANSFNENDLPFVGIALNAIPEKFRYSFAV
jgi:polysaccharide biosynthesis transport protein